MQQSRHHAAHGGEAVAEPTRVILSAYALLRLSPAPWRTLLRQLAAPAIRLHELRNARTRMWREAFCDLDRPCY